MTDPTRPTERFADDPDVALSDDEHAVADRVAEREPDDAVVLDARDDLDDRSGGHDWAWDDLDRSPVGATTPEPAPVDPEFQPDAIDTSAEVAADQPVASDSSFDRVSAQDLAPAPVDRDDSGHLLDPTMDDARRDESVAGDARDELVDGRGGDDRGLAYLPPSGGDQPAQRDASGRTTQRFDLADIKRVEVEGPATVHITTGGSGLLTVAAVMEDFDRIKVMEGRKDVKINFDGGFMDRKNPTQEIVYTFHLTGLTDLKLEKQVTAEVDSIDGGTVSVDMKGGSRLNVGKLDVKRLEAKLADKSQLSASGTADRQVVELAGESVYDGSRVQTDRTAVKARDKSQASLRVKTLLRAQALKHSTVHYAGEDVDLDIHTEDHGEVRNVAAH